MLDGPTKIVLIALAVLGVSALAFFAWARVRRRRRLRHADWIPLVSTSATGDSALARPSRRAPHVVHFPSAPRADAPSYTATADASDSALGITRAPSRSHAPSNHGDGPASNGHRNGAFEPPSPADAARFAPPPPPPPLPTPEYSNANDVMPEVRKRTIRYQIPVDQTLQFLPGRLEVIGGRETGQEIRFVRTDSDDGTSISFGRSEGPTYRHVQLFEPTVSRAHARMKYEQRLWHLTNLSTTNPVVLNGAPLSAEGSSVELNEGDRIEMGEAVFVFHVR